MVYGTSLPATSYQVLGLVNGDSAASIVGVPPTITLPNYTVHVGTYTETIGGAALRFPGDYTIAYVTGVLTVPPAN